MVGMTTDLALWDRWSGPSASMRYGDEVSADTILAYESSNDGIATVIRDYHEKGSVRVWNQQGSRPQLAEQTRLL